jgi:Flp pilus assembly secretin CpaC
MDVIADRTKSSLGVIGLLISAALVTFASVAEAWSEPAQPESDVIAMSRGSSELLHLPDNLTRVAVGDTRIANVIVLSPREILVNAFALGTTTLVVWDASDLPQTYTVEVSVDVTALNRQFRTLFPGEELQATAFGNIVVLTGTVSGAAVARPMVELARATGAIVIEHFTCIRPSVFC